MRISILIATYGGEEWRDLGYSRAYPSAATQDPFEVLNFHDPEGTIASVRNELGSTARGDWLCFLDADDELAPGYLGAMRRAFEQERTGGSLLLTPAVQAMRKGRQSGIAHFYDRGVSLSEDNWMVVGTLIQKDVFHQVGGFSDYPHGFEDWSLWYKATKCGARVVKVPGAVYLYHQNPQSKHRQGWRDRKWQVATHNRVKAELEAWTP